MEVLRQCVSKSMISQVFDFGIGLPNHCQRNFRHFVSSFFCLLNIMNLNLLNIIKIL